MPRKRAANVKPVQVPIPSVWRARVERAGSLMGRTAVHWVNEKALSLLRDCDKKGGPKESALRDFEGHGVLDDMMYLELPAATVDAIRGRFGRYSASRFLRLAIARGLGFQ